MRCQAGDLALIIRDGDGLGNEGREVDVIRWVQPRSAVPESAPIAVASRAGWVVRGRHALLGISLPAADPSIAVWPDEWLLPLRPDAAPAADELDEPLLEIAFG